MTNQTVISIRTFKHKQLNQNEPWTLTRDEKLVCSIHGRFLFKKNIVFRPCSVPHEPEFHSTYVIKDYYHETVLRAKQFNRGTYANASRSV